MLLECNWAGHTISLSQEALINSVLAHCNLMETTPVSMPLQLNIQLSAANCPTSQDEIDDMRRYPYRELVGALVWLVLGMRLDIAFAVSSLA